MEFLRDNWPYLLGAVTVYFAGPAAGLVKQGLAKLQSSTTGPAAGQPESVTREAAFAATLLLDEFLKQRGTGDTQRNKLLGELMPQLLGHSLIFKSYSSAVVPAAASAAPEVKP